MRQKNWKGNANEALNVWVKEYFYPFSEVENFEAYDRGQNPMGQLRVEYNQIHTEKRNRSLSVKGTWPGGLRGWIQVWLGGCRRQENELEGPILVIN